MAWFNWRNKKVEEGDHPNKNKPKMIDGWELKITEDNGRMQHSYTLPEMKGLFKIYKWYLTKDSPYYNVRYKDGMRILHRHNVVHMELNKKKIQDIWSNNDD